MKIMLGIPIKVEEIDNLQLALEKQYHHPKPNLCPHITLKAPIKMEGIDYNTFTRLAGVLDNASFGLHPFKIKLKGLGTFSNRVLFVKAEESEELNVLFEKINIQLEKAGFPLNKMEKERKAHITLAKEFPNGSMCYNMKDWIESLDLNLNNGGIEFTVDRIVLYGKDEEWREHHSSSLDTIL